MTAFLLARPVPALAEDGLQNITDATGATISIKKPVKSIVPLYGAFGEILLALGRGKLVTARTNADGEIPEFAHLPSVGTHMRPNPELIVAAKPDIVLQMGGRNDAQKITDTLRKLGIPVLVFEIDSFEQLFSVTQVLGNITGSNKEAENLVNSWKERLSALAQSGANKKPCRVFYEARYPNLLAAGTKGIVNDIILAAGATNMTNVPKKLARLSEEALIAGDPDVYIMQKGPMNPDPVPLRQRKNFKSLRAAQNTFVVDERKFARPGPHSVDAAEELAKILNHDSSVCAE